MEENNVVIAVKDQVTADLVGEAVVLNMESGVYYGLNSVGARIWELIQKPIRVEEIEKVIMAEYAVEKDACRQDVLGLLDELAKAELIEVRDEPHS